MHWTWTVFNRPPVIAETVHMDIQKSLSDYISEYIQSQRPSARNVVFRQIWTESIGKNKVKASFSYSFEDSDVETGDVDVALEGYAILNRANTDKSGNSWSFDELYILNDSVEFKTPMLIEGDLKDADEL